MVVEAGAKWSEVLRATLAQGKAPPVITEYIELSVGGHPVDLRVSVLPTMFGESCVLRVLDRTVTALSARPFASLRKMATKSCSISTIGPISGALPAMLKGLSAM